MSEYRGYTPHIEFGYWVWYRTTRSVSAGRNIKTGKEQRAGTHMTRIVTNATSEDDARAQLDRALTKPVTPKPKKDPSQTSLL